MLQRSLHGQVPLRVRERLRARPPTAAFGVVGGSRRRKGGRAAAYRTHAPPHHRWQGFTKFTAQHGFAKPNDERGLRLMNHAAVAVLEAVPDLVLAYGESDEFSFVFKKDTRLFQRRCAPPPAPHARPRPH